MATQTPSQFLGIGTANGNGPLLISVEETGWAVHPIAQRLGVPKDQVTILKNNQTLGISMKISRRKNLATGAALAFMCGTILTAQPAFAESGAIYSQTAEAYAYFDDSTDTLHVCDDRPGNGVGARALIKVQQEDGSWLTKDPVDSTGGCRSAARPVLREAARVQLWACSLATGGQQYNCQYRVLEGS